MHKIFGIKESKNYFDRRGAYLIPIKGEKIGIIKTKKGYFLLGGGLEHNETDEQCLQRECLEEAGYNIKVYDLLCSAETYCYHERIGNFHPIQTYYLGELLDKCQEPQEENIAFLWVNYESIKGKLYSDMQNWALEQAWSKKQTH